MNNAMLPALAPHDANLDLVLDRQVDVPVELVWKAWTEPQHLEQWFCPKPWRATDFTIDLRPGGAFLSTMHGPNGEVFPNSGCFLEVIPQRRLTFTDCLLPGFRPAPKPFMTASVTMEPHGGGTHYVARAIHGSDETRKQHEAMGFADGWATALDQLVAHIKASMR